MKKYIFAKADPTFKALFKEEKKRLKKIVKSKASIEHIGSTAVAGLGGKEILDILIGAITESLEDLKKKLKKDGFKFLQKASTNERLFLKKEIEFKDKKIWMHIHLTLFDSAVYNDLTFFRDYLKKHPKAVKEYIKIKKEALKKARGKGEIYRKHKKEFIEDILKKSI